MKDIKNFKNRTTKELTDTALKKIEFLSADAEPAALYHQND